MRTTVKLEDDVAAAVEHLQRKQGVGVSEAINQLARAGMARKDPGKRFRQRVVRMGEFRVDVSNVADAIEFAEGPAHR